MPIGRKPGVLGMVQDSNGHELLPKAPTQRTPTAAGSPYGGSALAFAGKIVAGRSRAGRSRYLSDASACVRKSFGLFARQLQRVSHAQAKHALFVVGKRDLAVEGHQGCNSIHTAHAG